MKFTNTFKRKNSNKGTTVLNHDSSAFYQASQDWTYDIYHSHSVWLKRTLMALIIVILLLGLSITANVLLLPLKEKVPFLYTFDNATGEVTKLGELEPTQLSANWQLTRYFIIHYVINRESYDADNIAYPYQLAWAMSDENIQKQYDNEVKSDVPTSPYRLYGKDKFITVKVLAVNRLNEESAHVRFEKTLHERTSNTEQVLQKEAIIKWKFTQPQTTQKLLERDPLGFKVTYYQVSQVNLTTHF